MIYTMRQPRMREVLALFKDKVKPEEFTEDAAISLAIGRGERQASGRHTALA
jgi:hypothetical protein